MSYPEKMLRGISNPEWIDTMMKNSKNNDFFDTHNGRRKTCHRIISQIESAVAEYLFYHDSVNTLISSRVESLFIPFIE